MPTEPPRPAPLSALSRALPPLPGALGAAALFSAVAGALALVPALFSMQVYDRVLGSRSGATLLMLLIAAVLALLGWTLLERQRQRVLQQLGAALDEVFAPRIAARRAAGRPGAAAADADLARLRQAFDGPALAALFDLPWLPLVLLALTLLHPALGALGATGCLLVLGLGALQRRLQRPSVEALQGLAQAERQAQEQLPERAAAWRLLGRTADGLDARAQAHRRWRAAQGRQLGAASGWAAVQRALRSGWQTGLLALGAWLVVGGEASAGVLIGASLLYGRLAGPLEALHQGGPQLREAWLAATRLVSLLDEPAAVTAPAAAGATGAAGAERPAPRLRASEAAIGWPGQGRPLLAGVSLQIDPGELLAVVGPACSGKTSLARLLLGLQAPVLGQVSADGLDWARLERSGEAPVRAWWGDTAPGPWATLGEAVTAGLPAEPRRLAEAAEAAGLADWVATLPSGWQTALGAGALQPSQHQGLALSLARLLYAQPVLAVFDEPGQLTDADAILRLRKAIAGLQARGATVLLLTGRASWARLAPRWLVLRDGRLQADGPASELARRLGMAPDPAEAA